MRRKLIAGNWKMNGSLAANRLLLAGVKAGLPVQGAFDVAVCVPFPYLSSTQSDLVGSAVSWGAQDLSCHESGAFTGEVSASMLTEFGCRYVLVGHSERRAYHAESDEHVATKVVRALAVNLTPIVCVGETLEQRESGQTDTVTGCQLDAVLAAVAEADLARIVIAYEPVWAIGTGKTATAEMAQKVHAALRARLAVKNSEAAEKIQILYGGSMKPDNARQLLSMPDIDGGLIGGAALKAEDFLAIAAACQ
ncbi:MAG: triose-phosphate isomerase [Herminiimonas sp.]|nr:triose-phosphate isomerase [Herminiimonas sp.]